MQIGMLQLKAAYFRLSNLTDGQIGTKLAKLLASNYLFYLQRSNLSTAIIPMAAAFQWDSLFSGLVLSAFWAGYALTQVLGGKLADKYGGQSTSTVLQYND